MSVTKSRQYLVARGMEEPVTREELMDAIISSMYIDNISAGLIADKVLSKFEVKRKIKGEK